MKLIRLTLVTFFVCILQASAESFRITRDVTLEYTPDRGGLYLSVGGTPTKCRFSTSHWNHDGKKGWKITPDPAAKSLKVTGGFVEDRDHEDVSTYETVYQYIDGTNAVIRSDITYLSDAARRPCGQTFMVYTQGMPKDTTVELLGMDGKTTSFQPLNQEVLGKKDGKDVLDIKDVKKVTVKCGVLYAVIEPGKDTRLYVSDTRAKDAAVQAVVISASSTIKGKLEKGGKHRIETKVQLSKRQGATH